MKHIGFTGTRHGMTVPQRAAIDALLRSETFDVMFHHGDCVGADAEAHDLALKRGHHVNVHPPTDLSRRAFCIGYAAMDAPSLHLVRNRAIVNASDVMIAAPYEMEEQERGGTWATIRMTRKAGKPLAIVYPDGTVSMERWT